MTHNNLKVSSDNNKMRLGGLSIMELEVLYEILKIYKPYMIDKYPLIYENILSSDLQISKILFKEGFFNKSIEGRWETKILKNHFLLERKLYIPYKENILNSYLWQTFTSDPKSDLLISDYTITGRKGKQYLGKDLYLYSYLSEENNYLLQRENSKILTDYFNQNKSKIYELSNNYQKECIQNIHNLITYKEDSIQYLTKNIILDKHLK